MKESVRIFKLANGENIVGGSSHANELFDFESSTIQISLPLKMIIIPRMTKSGPAESLSLSPWVHPMTENECIDINSKNIVMTAIASKGLARYYAHCVNQFDFINEGMDKPLEIRKGPTDEELNEIESESAIEELKNPDKPTTIH